MNGNSIGKDRREALARIRFLVELAIATLAALALAAWRLDVRARFAPLDVWAAGLALLGVAAGVSALIASRWADRRDARFWALIAAACFVWDSGRANPSVLDRHALLLFNGDYAFGVALFAIAIGWRIHAASSPLARRKLALDLLPQLIALAVAAWLLWLGPQTLSRATPGLLKTIDLGHGAGDVLVLGLCSAGIIARRQGIAGAPPKLLMIGVGLLALGDAVALPAWERDASLLSAASRAMLCLGFAAIGLAALHAWRTKTQAGDKSERCKPPSAWTSQLPNLTLIGLLLVAIVQIVAGQWVRGGIATSILAGGVVIVFGMMRQSLTVRRERRLRLEIDELSTRIDGLVSQVGRDPLTGLLNHRAVYERLQREIDHARLAGSAIAVALIDVDNFKTVNDRRGHQAGDDVLRVVASILTGACRATDVAARYAGDEFMLILPGVDELQAANVCQRIVDEVRRVNGELHLGQDIGVTLSVGVAISRRRGRDARDLVALADAAMYDAKDGGKDRLVVVNAETLTAIGASRAAQAASNGEAPLAPTAPRREERRRPSWAERAS